MSGLAELKGIVERVTFVNEQNGWSVIKVQPVAAPPGQLVTVVLHQAQVFAGATMAFQGNWIDHPKFGRQFKASQALEQKPATLAGLEKFLGSGLIPGLGPKTARLIVEKFGEQTLQVFENEIHRLQGIKGIGDRKLEAFRDSWVEHKAVRDVMTFLQSYGVSTLLATRIYKFYGDRAIPLVSADPYRLALDIHGVGFFTADKIAKALGVSESAPSRIRAGLLHSLQGAREQGHCYVTLPQLQQATEELLRLSLADYLESALASLMNEKLIIQQTIDNQLAIFTPSLFYAERTIRQRLQALVRPMAVDGSRVQEWLTKYSEAKKLTLAPEQVQAIHMGATQGLSILTGGPGCGKTFTVQTLVQLAKAMKRTVLMAAPTGRAAQRMSEVTGVEAKTIHRLLEWQPNQGKFARDENNPLPCDFLIVDEVSMLDVQLAAALLSSVSAQGQVFFVGDPDQLPSVGPGSVLRDLLSMEWVPRVHLKTVFRQAQQSQIIQTAHAINSGQTPSIINLVQHPQGFAEGSDCLLVESEEPTQEQLDFLRKAKRILAQIEQEGQATVRQADQVTDLYQSQSTIVAERRWSEADVANQLAWRIPDKFRHVDWNDLLSAKDFGQEIRAIGSRLPRFSTLRKGVTASESLLHLTSEWLPKNLPKAEWQVLTPMTRGSLGTISLNKLLQEKINPAADSKAQLVVGNRIFRQGDRVIQNRNNYDLEIFNGDIGSVVTAYPLEQRLTVRFGEGNQGRTVDLKGDALLDCDLAYAITIHKSQGSEFPVVIIPISYQHFRMLNRSIIYTGLTRARKLAIFVGSSRAITFGSNQNLQNDRQTGLLCL